MYLTCSQILKPGVISVNLEIGVNFFIDGRSDEGGTRLKKTNSNKRQTTVGNWEKATTHLFVEYSIYNTSYFFAEPNFSELNFLILGCYLE